MTKPATRPWKEIAEELIHATNYEDKMKLAHELQAALASQENPVAGPQPRTASGPQLVPPAENRKPQTKPKR